jgi:hypothetical protein
MFAGKARAYPSEAPFRCSTLGTAPGLLRKSINYGHKKIYSSGPRRAAHKSENTFHGQAVSWSVWYCQSLPTSSKVGTEWCALGAPLGYASASPSNRVEMTDSDKHSSLLQYGIFYSRKSSMVRKKVRAGKANWRERLSTIDLHIKLDCFIWKLFNIFNINSCWSKLFSTRSSTVLSLPLQ